MTNFRPHIARLLWPVWLITCLLLWCGLGSAQTAVLYAPEPIQQLFDQNGRPLAFGCVFSYQVASSTPLATYTDYTGTTLNANPVILSASGTYSMWLQAGVAYTLVVKSAGGSNCSSGSTIAFVNGIGGGSTTLTTVVPFSPTPAFQVAAQNQLFELTLTGNASAQPLTFVGITPPSYVIFQITQDGSGGHTFSFPANTIGGCTVDPVANSVTTLMLVYNGVNATAIGPCVTGNGPAIITGSIQDTGLTPSLPICTDANNFLTSTCTGLIPVADLVSDTILFNGQAAMLGGVTGNVNAGDAAHSIALNEGDGNQLGALALTSDQVAVGVTSADPAAKSLCTGSLSYNTSTHVFSCPVEQYGNVAGCVASVGPCTVTLTWGTAFADNTYFAFCTPVGPETGNPQGAFFYIDSHTTTQLVIGTDNVGTTHPGGYTSFNCWAHHN